MELDIKGTYLDSDFIDPKDWIWISLTLLEVINNDKNTLISETVDSDNAKPMLDYSAVCIVISMKAYRFLCHSHWKQTALF